MDFAVATFNHFGHSPSSPRRFQLTTAMHYANALSNNIQVPSLRRSIPAVADRPIPNCMSLMSRKLISMA